MIQVWRIDNNGFYTGESYFVDKEEKESNEISTYIGNVGFYKAKWTGTEWVEGATQQEIAEYKEAHKPQQQLTEVEKLQQQLLDTQAYLVTQAENKYKEVTNV